MFLKICRAHSVIALFLFQLWILSVAPFASFKLQSQNDIPIYLAENFRIFQKSIFPSCSSSQNRRIHLHGAQLNIREWKRGDGKAILDLLMSAEDGSFNPEGGLEMDCISEDLLEQSYSANEGCFLVAEIQKEGSSGNAKLVGTAGLIVGTPVKYYSSGVSMSSAQISAAVRRCCCRYIYSSSISTNMVLEKILTTIEQRALRAGATELIALAYPVSKDIKVTIGKPKPELLEKLGYQKLPGQLPGITAIQYGKTLDGVIPDNQNAHCSVEKFQQDVSSTNAIAPAIGVGLLGMVLVGWASLAQFMGLDTMLPISSETEALNRGLGRPLSSQDVEQLLKDEQLKRTTLDDSARNREWKDLGLEEKREEMALMQIINGQNIRIKFRLSERDD